MLATASAPSRLMPLSRALTILQGEPASEGARQDASNVVALLIEPCVRNVCRKWVRCDALRSTLPTLEDLGQEARLRAFEKAVPKFRIPEGKPEPEVEALFARFVIVVLGSHFLDMRKRSIRNSTRHAIERPASLNRRVGRGSQDARGGELGDLMEAPLDSMSLELDEAEILGSLRRSLAPDDFEIAYLRYEGKSLTEIAGTLGMNVKAIRDRLARVVGPMLAPRLAAAGVLLPS